MMINAQYSLKRLSAESNWLSSDFSTMVVRTTESISSRIEGTIMRVRICL